MADGDYSHVPLWRKLGIREGSRVALANAPTSLRTTLGELPAGARLLRAPAAGSDVVVWFPASAAALTAGFARYRATLRSDGGLWVAWPKRRSGIPTDLDFTLIQRTGLDAGLVDNKQCSVDDVFSALRFVYRRADRPRHEERCVSSALTASAPAGAMEGARASMAMTSTRFHDLGDMPELGTVPERMLAQVVRPERYGPPQTAFEREEIPTPRPRPGEALVYVMAAGVNYNNVWAALGRPVDVVRQRNKAGEPEGFHVGGSDASGIVWEVGEGVEGLKVGDEVVVHCGVWDADDSWVVAGRDPILAPSARIWGYETNWGSFAQFTRVQAHQCLPKPARLPWAAAAAYMLVGATAYRMLLGWPPHTVEAGDVVLVWGGSGGLGCQAIQIARAQGARPVAVVSDPARGEWCKQLGAVGYLNRRDFSHWGAIPDWRDDAAYGAWAAGARAFGKALWEVVGERRSPRLVFEHPGEETIPTSTFVCDSGGMVVICAGTSGYEATVDLRYLWMRQKRLQGSHFANDEQAAALNEMVARGEVDPCLSRTFGFDEVGMCHQLMHDNRHPRGNMAVLVGARSADQVDRG